MLRLQPSSFHTFCSLDIATSNSFHFEMVGAINSGLVSLSFAFRADFRPDKFCEIYFTGSLIIFNETYCDIHCILLILQNPSHGDFVVLQISEKWRSEVKSLKT